MQKLRSDSNKLIFIKTEQLIYVNENSQRSTDLFHVAPGELEIGEKKFEFDLCLQLDKAFLNIL
jgi:hypothetical protein